MVSNMKRKIFAWGLTSIFGLLIIRHRELLFARTFPKLPNNKDTNIVPCGSEANSCITLITAYFNLDKSKHTHTQYLNWISNFLGQVQNPMVIFTQPSLRLMMAKLRQGKPTHFILYDTIWDLPWLAERKKFLYDQYHKMHDIDHPEKYRHSPELYAVWNSKPWMLQMVSTLNPFNSTYFFWIDIGCVRNATTKLKGFPNTARAIQVFGRDERSDNFHKLNLFAMSKFVNYKSPPERNNFEEMEITFIQAGFFGGTVLGVDWFTKEFYALHDSKLKEGVFVGIEQTLMNWIAIQQRDKILVVCYCLHQTTPWECGGAWWYFQPWYGTNDNNSKCVSAPVRIMTEFLTEYQKNSKSIG